MCEGGDGGDDDDDDDGVMVVPWCGNVDQLHNLNVHMSKYCIAVLVYTLAVSQSGVLHRYIRGLA